MSVGGYGSFEQKKHAAAIYLVSSEVEVYEKNCWKCKVLFIYFSFFSNNAIWNSEGSVELYVRVLKGDKVGVYFDKTWLSMFALEFA